MENEKKVNTPKVEVQKKEVIESGYEGITIVRDENFIPRSELTREDIKKFPLVLAVILSRYYLKEANERDSIQFRIYPFLDKKSKGYEKNVSISLNENLKEYYKFVKLNDDNKEVIDRNEFASIMLSSRIPVKLENQKIIIPRFGRFITAVKDGRRHYRLQVFLSFDLVRTLFINDQIMKLISMSIKAGYISPVEFIEATTDELDIKPIQTKADLVG